MLVNYVYRKRSDCFFSDVYLPTENNYYPASTGLTI